MALPSEEKSSPLEVPLLPHSLEPLVTSLYAQSGAARWGLSRGQFVGGLERSARKRFADGAPVPEKLEEYFVSLHIEDLSLATACLEGCEPAWEYFVQGYRSYLQAAAGAISKASRYGANPQELADALFSDLFGLADGKRGERSLFRYFHGRSSLKTWLRTVLAQRYVDHIRSQRRWESLDADDAEKREPPREPVQAPLTDPHRERYLSCFTAALRKCMQLLHAGDHERLELYYARQMKLAEMGRRFGEHESSVSRSLERIRRELRELTERHLREVFSLSDAEIQQCFEYAAEEAPIDFRQMFPDRGRPVKGKGPS